MRRIIGIICGSATVIALLLFAIGPPRFATTNTTQAVDILPPAIDVVEPVTPDAPLPDTMLAEEVAIPASDAVDAPNAADEIVEPIRTDLQPSAATQQEESWYAFWSPFRTELAANGFVQRLQQRTGLDYRVVRMDSGTYEVAFAYLDQTDVDQKLLAISAATGLELAVDPLE